MNRRAKYKKLSLRENDYGILLRLAAVFCPRTVRSPSSNFFGRRVSTVLPVRLSIGTSPSVKKGTRDPPDTQRGKIPTKKTRPERVMEFRGGRARFVFGRIRHVVPNARDVQGRARARIVRCRLSSLYCRYHCHRRRPRCTPLSVTANGTR